MTVGKKLLVSAGATLALTVAIGIASLNSINNLNRELETATQKTARRLQLAGVMDAASANMLSGMRGIVLFTYGKDEPMVEKCGRQFDSAATMWQKSIDEVRPLVIREDGRQLVDQSQAHLSQWRTVIEEVKQAAFSGNPELAMRTALAKALPIYQANSRDMVRFLEIQNEILTAQRRNGASIYRSSWLTAFGLLALTLVTGAGALVVVRKTNLALQTAASELGRTAEQVSSAASQISSSSQTLAQGASEQAATLQETSASSAQVSAMTHKNAEDCREAAGLMKQAGQVVNQANDTLVRMEASMQGINESSERIGKIIRVIDEIAFQTNILALNAAVEAARAGEAGMGFAVVADEVRNLAQRSAQAAKDTAGMIEESILKSTEGRAKLEEVSAAIRAITESVNKVKTLVNDINNASGEQAQGVQQISKAIAQIELVVQSSAASAEQAASAGEELTSQAGALRGVVSRLEDLVGVGNA